MSLTSGIAIYFIIWWLALFVVLPFGVKNAVEAGESVAEGDDPGAPVNPMLLKKALITTVISAAVFAGVYVFVARYW
jgi:predicted secreted protein